MSILRDLLHDIEAGPPMAVENLTIVPLRAGGARVPATDYLLAADAFDRGQLTVTEVHADGVVAVLSAISTADMPILLLDGEELIGAKQNRILNTDVLLRPKGKAVLPVSCVEQGRWQHDRPDFGSGGCAPSELRARKSRSVSESLERDAAPRSDQGEVWDDVAAMHRRLGTSSPTTAMADAFRARAGDLDRLVRSFTYVADTAGVVVFINGGFAALDLFDCPVTLQKLWTRLITSYAVDALAAAKATVEVSADGSIDQLLTGIATTDCRVHPGVDLGQDWRFDSSTVVGSALVVDGVAVHVSVFPGEPNGGPGREGRASEHGGRIASPRRRRVD